MSSISESLSGNKPVKYLTHLQIVIDLSLTLPEMEALTELFADLGPFTFIQEPSIVISDKFHTEDEGEHIINGITFYFLKPKNVSSRS